LREELKNTDPHVRIAVLGAMNSVAEKEAVAAAQALLEDRDDRVRMASARLLARAGERSSLATLVRLLDAKELEIRAEAGRTLKALTGQDFGFVAYDGDAVRNAARD